MSSHAAQGIPVLGSTVYVHVPAAQSGGRFGLVEVLVPPGVGVPPHRHTREDELLWMLEGCLRVAVEGVEREYAAGAAAVIPRDALHAFQNAAAAPARLLAAYNPAGFEAFFPAAGALAASRGPALTFAEIAALAAQHGTVLLPPG